MRASENRDRARFVPARIALALVAALTLFATLPAFGGGRQMASAHPLGNFTVNRYARIELAPGKVHLRYVLDIAEIPAFQELQGIDRDRDGAVSDPEATAYLDRRLPELARGLDLRLNDARIDLAVAGRSLATPEGQGGLKTLRLVIDFQGAMPAGWQQGLSASFKDSNYSDRIGWKEVVVRGAEGVALTHSSAPSEDQSAELSAYPGGLLKSPLDVSQASFDFAARDPAAAPALSPVEGRAEATSRTPPKSLGGFARLVERQKLTPAFVALSLLAAMAWGAAHALGPGHGKTIVGAYLVGSRGTARHALALGLTVTATHTSSVVALGLVTLYASRYIAAQDLYLWLSVASGLVVVAMGLGLLWSRLRVVRRRGHGHPHVSTSEHHQHHEHSDSGHDPEHGHSHLPAAPGWRGLVMLGISGGLLPCPTALVVMLGAIALDRVAYGLVLIAAFSAGLAGVLTGIGLLLVYARRVMDRLAPAASASPRLRLPLRALQLTPVLSALLILAVGLVLTGQAISAL